MEVGTLSRAKRSLAFLLGGIVALTIAAALVWACSHIWNTPESPEAAKAGEYPQRTMPGHSATVNAKKAGADKRLEHIISKLPDDVTKAENGEWMQRHARPPKPAKGFHEAVFRPLRAC